MFFSGAFFILCLVVKLVEDQPRFVAWGKGAAIVLAILAVGSIALFTSEKP